MLVRRNAKRKRFKRATASALRKKRYDTGKFIDRSRPLVEKCLYCMNRSDKGRGSWICNPCIDKMNPPPDTSLGLAVFGIQTGIDVWVNGQWFLSGMLVDKYAKEMTHTRKPTRRWRW